MNEYTILVPQSFNDGRLIPDSVTDRLKSYAVDTFGGLTISGSVSGLWRDNGITYSDTLSPYIVATSDYAAVLAFAQLVAELCDQLSVYVSQSSALVSFVSRQ